MQRRSLRRRSAARVKVARGDRLRSPIWASCSVVVGQSPKRMYTARRVAAASPVRRSTEMSRRSWGAGS